MRKLAAHPAALKRARRNAINGTVTWASRTLVKDLAAKNKIPMKMFRGSKGKRKRLFLKRPRANSSSGSVWLGIQPIAYTAEFWKFTETDGGVTVKGGGVTEFIKGGFVARMNSGYRGVFTKRGTAIGQKPKANKSNIWQWTWLPIQKEGYKIEDGDVVVSRVADRLPVMMADLMRDKLRDQLRKVR